MHHPRRLDFRAARQVLLPVTVCLLAAGMATACRSTGSAEDHRPRLIVDDSVASDLGALAQETWSRFLGVFQVRSDCFGDVRLHAAYSQENLGSYDPETATAVIQVPGTSAMLQSALIHEWAHHLDYQCEAARELRLAFLEAQGLPADTPWRVDYAASSVPAQDWAAIPSEQFAEAVIEVVLGDEAVPGRARVTRQALQLIQAWAVGKKD